jgi:hypothetical protein
MSGLLCSESWHTSSSTEGYRSWFNTVWLCCTVGSGKSSSSSWGQAEGQVQAWTPTQMSATATGRVDHDYS